MLLNLVSTRVSMGQSIRQLADGVMGLPLEETVEEKWLYQNVASLFGVG